MQNFDWENIKLNIFTASSIESKVNADKLFVSFLLEVEKREFSPLKEYTISEISELVPIGTAGITNYSTYGFSIMSMLSSQKGRDYFIFNNSGLRDEFTTICNNNHDRDNYYWRRYYANEGLKINPKYIKWIEPKSMGDYLRDVLSFYEGIGSSKVYDNKLFDESNAAEMIYPRLQRAAFDHTDNKAPATFSRYAIWASSLKSLLLDAKNMIENGECDRAIKKLILATNSVGAYIDIQAIFDSYFDGMRFYKPEDIIGRYNVEKEINYP